MHNFEQLFTSITVPTEQHGIFRPVFQVLGEEPGLITLGYSLPRGDETLTGQIDLPVPIITPVRFPWDGGLFGHKVIVLRGSLQRPGAERFCAPLLMSPTGDWIAATRDRTEFILSKNWQFGYANVYCRLHQAYAQAVRSVIDGQRRPDARLLWSRMHRAARELLNRLPLTDEAKVLRQMFEVELGYPDIPSDNWLFEQVKLKYVEHIDPTADVLCTGKTDVGRFVARVRPDAPKSHITGKPLSDLALAVSPLGPWGIPIRFQREGRAVVDCHDFENPIAPPLRIAGIKVPEPIAQKVTTVNVLFADVIGQNVFVADEDTAEEFGIKEGDELCLDAILVTPSGRRKLRVIHNRSELMGAEEFLEHKDELAERPGFQFEEIPDLMETMLDGTPVFAFQYRYRYDVPIPCRYDKIKLLQGGLKGVTRPIRQLFAQVGDERQEVDIVVAEKALLSKAGIRDAAMYALAGMAGLSDIDPTWSFDELCDRVQSGLKLAGVPEDGRFEIQIRQKTPIVNSTLLDDETRQTLENMGVKIGYRYGYEPIGKGIFGPIPVIRTQEIEDRQAGVRGVSVNIQARILGGVPFQFEEADRDRVEQYARFVYTADDLQAATTLAVPE